MEVYDRIMKYKSYFIWFLSPLLLMHAVNFVDDVLSILKSMSLICFMVFVVLFFLGITLNLVSRLPSFDKSYLAFFEMRLNKYVPMFRWGHCLVEWLMEREDNESK